MAGTVLRFFFFLAGCVGLSTGMAGALMGDPLTKVLVPLAVAATAFLGAITEKMLSK